ncbi:uncharacterized protein LOC143518698 [Brachyhypopomus gauderio]|uniref:uncharacterized protein LOC143518698 n=1 Tax=Brachyhypopomus gauderio TaxID=698409 RepID=UPI0040425D17
MAETEKLIKSVCGHPELYDSTSNEYRSNEKRVAAWNRVGASVGLSAHECRRRWKSVRDRYIRERRLSKLTKEEGGRVLGFWCHRESLTFLNPYIRERQDHRDEDMDDESDTNEENLVVALRESQFGLKQEPLTAVSTVEGMKLVKLKHAVASQVMPDIITPQMKSLPQTPLGCVPLEKEAPQMTRSEVNDGVASGLKVVGPSRAAHQDLTAKNDISLSPLQLSPPAADTDVAHQTKAEGKGTDRRTEKRVSHRAYDEDELFLLSFVPVFKRLSPQKRGAAKIKIHQIMYDAEFSDQ